MGALLHHFRVSFSSENILLLNYVRPRKETRGVEKASSVMVECKLAPGMSAYTTNSPDNLHTQ